jgi:hypothetical protein
MISLLFARSIALIENVAQKGRCTLTVQACGFVRNSTHLPDRSQITSGVCQDRHEGRFPTGCLKAAFEFLQAGCGYPLSGQRNRCSDLA